jgi:outer membrane protein TolC
MKTPFSLSLFFWLLIYSAPSMAQEALQRYIDEGLKNNLVLQQRSIGLEKAMVSLRIANSYFMPSVGIQGNYTSGRGGRSISFPVGDMLNPVYSTLNQLTGTSNFPQIENVNTTFFPYNFYDAKVHTTVPIVNTDLIYNRKISQQQVELQAFEVDIYRRELIRTIKVAYFNYLSATEAVGIFASARARSEEGKRVNESLLANGKGLPAYVLRSNSEIESTRALHDDALRQVENASLYFNFLLNRPADAPIEAEAINWLTLDLNVGDSVTTSHREELKLLREQVALSKNVVRMNKLFWVPRVNGFLDLGSQAQDWKVNNNARYYLLGVQLDVPLFAGFRNRNKTALASLDQRTVILGYDNSRRQIDLSAQAARNNLLTAYQNFQSAQKQQEAASSYHRLIEKGYQEGVNTFIEAVDARNQLTQSQLQVSINRFKVLSALANYERETATYELPSSSTAN